MSVLFQAWGYEVTILELAAVITSLLAVYLGALGTRRAWPWWILSSALYGLFFINVDLILSCHLCNRFYLLVLLTQSFLIAIP